MKASFPCEFDIWVFFFFSTRPWFCISTKNYWPAMLVAFMPKTVSFSFPSKSKTAFKNEIKMCLCFGFAKILRNATGSVSGKYVVGGLVGLVNNPESIIENSYSSGSVSALGMAGGLVGNLSGKIKNSYSSGSVVSKQSRVNRLGVLAGEYGSEGTIIKSFGKSQSGVSNTRGQKTDAELKDPSTFSSWDKNIWKIESGKYPKLKVFLN